MTMRLAPSMTPDTQFFWDGLKNHTLLIQCCTQCDVVRHPPRPMCPRCNSVEWHTIDLDNDLALAQFQPATQQ